MSVGIVVFPGSNCDRDMHHVLSDVYGMDARYVWHEDRIPGDTDAVILPGGFSYGDRLRAGAIAARSQVMRDVADLSGSGMPVLGICNGFQILVESGMLPGALIMNDSRGFMCGWTSLVVQNDSTPFTCRLAMNQEVPIPIANGEGRYHADPETLDEMAGNNQIVFTYRNRTNGSARDIAGICSPDGNVVGMMPHPERAAEDAVGPGGGAASLIFESLLERLGVAR